MSVSGQPAPRRIRSYRAYGTVDIRFQQQQQGEELEAESARPESAGFVPLRRWSPGGKLRPSSRMTETEPHRHVATQFRREALASGAERARVPAQRQRSFCRAGLPDWERPHSVAHSLPGTGRPRSPFSDASYRVVARPMTAEGLRVTPPASRPRLGDWSAQSAEEVATVLTEKFAAETAQLQHAGFHRVDGPVGLWISRSVDDLRPWSPLLSAMLDRAHPARTETSLDPGGHRQPKIEQKDRRRQSGFFAFVAEQRPLLLNNLSEASSADLAAVLTELWKDLSPEERRKYDDIGDTAATSADLGRRFGKRQDSGTIAPVECPGTGGGTRPLMRVSPTLGQRSPSLEHPKLWHETLSTSQRVQFAPRVESGVPSTSGSEPALLQVEEKIMAPHAKGAPLHLGHFSSASARAHHTQMLQHKKLQQIRLTTGKRKPAESANGLATTDLSKPTTAAASGPRSTTPEGRGVEGSAESRKPVRGDTMMHSRQGCFYPVQIASPSLFVG